MLAEWMDVGSVALIGFAVALTLLHLSVRPSVAVRWAKRNKRTDMLMLLTLHVLWYMGDQVSFGHDHL